MTTLRHKHGTQTEVERVHVVHNLDRRLSTVVIALATKSSETSPSSTCHPLARFKLLVLMMHPVEIHTPSLETEKKFKNE